MLLAGGRITSSKPWKSLKESEIVVVIHRRWNEVSSQRIHVNMWALALRSICASLRMTRYTLDKGTCIYLYNIASFQSQGFAMSKLQRSGRPKLVDARHTGYISLNVDML